MYLNLFLFNIYVYLYLLKYWIGSQTTKNGIAPTKQYAYSVATVLFNN